MCIFTDGYKDDLRVSNTSELYRSALELFNNYNPAKHLHLMQQLGNTSMSEHQFCTNIGQNEALSVFAQWLPKETAKNVAY